MKTTAARIEVLERRRINFLVLAFSFLLFAAAFSVNTHSEVFQGEWLILTSPSILITDYVALAGPGAALFNSALVTLIGLLVANLVRARFNGLLLAAIFTMSGFAFFGKNPFNILPVMLGVCLFNAIFHRQPLRDLIAPLLFGTTLAPLVSQTAFGFGFGWMGLILGILVGILAGMLLPALMNHIYSIHLGYNLYNTGTTGGFVALTIFMFMRGFGLEIEPLLYWSTDHTLLFTLLAFVILVSVIILGWVWGGRLQVYRQLLARSGRLPSDFIQDYGLGITLVNMGLVGLLALAYIHLVGGDVNGATLAGVFTVFGFGALGKHPRNILPVMLGVYLICFIKIWAHNDPGPLLAALFCTTLAPFSGRFGFLAGLLAGALHLPMVMHVGSLHGFMNLYNNGFAGGLAMLIIIGFVKAVRPAWLED